LTIAFKNKEGFIIYVGWAVAVGICPSFRESSNDAKIHILGKCQEFLCYHAWNQGDKNKKFKLRGEK
jgi:hypothetical protein